MAAYSVTYVLMKLVTLLSLLQQNLLLLNHHRVEQTIIEDTLRHFMITLSQSLFTTFAASAHAHCFFICFHLFPSYRYSAPRGLACVLQRFDAYRVHSYGRTHFLRCLRLYDDRFGNCLAFCLHVDGALVRTKEVLTQGLVH